MSRLPRSALIAVAAMSSVLVAFLLSVAWMASVPGVARFEPATQALGLLGGLAGGLAERRAAARERRAQALRALARELCDSASVLASPQFTPDLRPRPMVYPRLPLSAVDAAVVSGALADRADAELARRLHEWQDLAAGFNRRLDLTEMCTFITGRADDITDIAWELAQPDGRLAETRDLLRELHAFLATKYLSASTPAAAVRVARARRPRTRGGLAARALLWSRRPRWVWITRRLVRRAARG